MKILIASDHAGFEMKSGLVEFLNVEGHEVEDMGPHDFEAGDDYPDYIFPLAVKVSTSSDYVGIILGGSGQGEAMVANRVSGVRATTYYAPSAEVIMLSREHNNANVLSLGARFLTLDEAKEAVKLWLATPFSGDERHTRRIAKIDQLL